MPLFRVGQAGPPLSPSQLRVLLGALAQTFRDLESLPGYGEGPGYSLVMRFREVVPDVFSVWIRVEDSLGLVGTSSTISYVPQDLASADDVILTTLAQTQQVTEYWAPAYGPEFLDIVNDVGPDNFAGLLSLLALAVF